MKSKKLTVTALAAALSFGGLAISQPAFAGDEKKAEKKDAAKGKRKSQGKTDPERKKLTDAEKAKIKCTYFQVLWHGDAQGCKQGDKCKFKHEVCATKEEYDALYKPWENGVNRQRSQSATGRGGQTSAPRSPSNDSTKGGGRGKGGKGGKADGGKGKRIYAMSADMGHFCKKYMACPGRAPPEGDGTCEKVHCTETDCKLSIKQFREKTKADAEALKAKLAKGDGK